MPRRRPETFERIQMTLALASTLFGACAALAIVYRHDVHHAGTGFLYWLILSPFESVVIADIGGTLIGLVVFFTTELINLIWRRLGFQALSLRTRP
ncbi:MAG: hypothetical protein J0H44_28830 [Alphaproteobacteria bacterium]|nr:hypothetical protein [Alphaproteobacteria bacterium]